MIQITDKQQLAVFVFYFEVKHLSPSDDILVLGREEDPT